MRSLREKIFPGLKCHLTSRLVSEVIMKLQNLSGTTVVSVIQRRSRSPAISEQDRDGPWLFCQRLFDPPAVPTHHAERQ